MLAHLAPMLGFTVVVRDVDADPVLQRLFTDVIPVIVVGGVVVAEAPVDQDQLRAVLEAALASDAGLRRS